MKQYIYTPSLYTHTAPSHIHTSPPQEPPRLLLFFAGWGMDEHPFLQYAPQDSDFMICYDYRTLDFDTSPLTGYTVIDVVAWSMGGWAASQVLSKVSLRRMWADGNVFARFQLTAPERSIEELKEELAAVAEQYRILPTGTFAWEQAIIGESDRIFPPTNQRAAWKGISMSNIDGNEAHYDESLFIKYLKEI